MRTFLLLAFAVLVSWSPHIAHGAPPTLIRFVDLAPVSRATAIDGTRMRVLDPLKREHVFPLQDVPVAPVLRFAVGRRPFEGSSTVRFEIWLRQKDQASTPLYSREISGAGWIDERLDLGTRKLYGTELVFVRSVVEGPGSQLFASVWGELVLWPGATPAAPSVLLISLDTLRADRLGVYGNDAARTPTLDALARAGVWYAQAYSPSTWTYPSHESLFF